jgi:hypothetical protein
MYGYAIVPKNFGCCFRNSAGVTEWRGTSAVVGALGWKTPSSCHFFWYFFSIAIRVFLFSVYIVGLLRMCVEERAGAVLTPFNSFVWETATVSSAFTADSILAMMLESD